MAKVITVSRTFPAYHPKAGQPTYFVEKILNALGIDYHSHKYLSQLRNLNPDKNKDMLTGFFLSVGMLNDTPYEKLHTIRSGHRWKQGDKASIRVWSGKPYNSPQIIIAPEVELVNVLDFMIHTCRENINWIDVGSSYFHSSDMPIDQSIIPMVAKNDGLSTEDLLAWFKYPNPFFGQILAWKPVNYL